MRNVNYNENEVRAADIIKQKLEFAGGKAKVSSISGKVYEIKAGIDGKSFLCDELPINPPYEYRVFDVIVRLLIKKGGRAEKGNGRNFKLGQSRCTVDTVVGAIGAYYAGRREGESVFDPVFVLASVLDWAGIAKNCRGYIELTKEYKHLFLGNSKNQMDSYYQGNNISKNECNRYYDKMIEPEKK